MQTEEKKEDTDRESGMAEEKEAAQEAETTSGESAPDKPEAREQSGENAPEDKKRKRGLGLTLRWLLMLVCLAVIIYEGVQLYRDRQEDRIAGDEYEDLARRAVRYPETGEGKPLEAAAEGAGETYPELEIDFETLKEINPDCIGWLYFGALEISYPVVRENTPDEYLHLTFEGKANKAGCIFMDVLSNPDFRGYSDMLFGHNMRNGSMFGRLKLLLKEENAGLLQEDPYVYVYTADAVYRYEVFAYYQTVSGSHAYDEIRTDGEYREYLDFIAQNNRYDAPHAFDFSKTPSLLTLSTCTGASGGNRRFVVHTVKTYAWLMQ